MERSFAPLAFLAVVGSSVAIASAGCDVCGSQQECGVVATTNDGAVSGGNPCHPQDGALYPTTGCGFGKGLVIDDYAWTGRLAGISSPVTTLKLHDYYNPDGSKPAKYLFMTVSAFWCQACKDEAKHLNALFDKYAGRVLVVTDIAQKVDRSITDQTDVDVWIKSFALHTAVVTDPGFVLQNFFEPSTMPLDLIIDLKTMTVVYDTTGAVLPSVESFLDSAP